jgi:hypothetical protein
MAWYDITYKCGHSDRVQIYGPLKLRDGKIRWYETCFCSECGAAERKKARLERLEEMKNQAEIMELPNLIGTEKQIAWALEIRAKFLDDAQRKAKAVDSDSINGALFRVMTDNSIRHNEAHWWIENRKTPLANFSPITGEIYKLENGLKSYFGVEEISDATEEIVQMSPEELYSLMERIAHDEHIQRGVTPVTPDEVKLAAEVEAERTIRPESPSSEAVCKIVKAVNEDGSGYVSVQPPAYIQEIVSIFRKSGFTWKRSQYKWILRFKANHPDINDRIIEIAVQFLSRGYSVSVPEKWMVERVLKSDYQPMQTRWVRTTPDGEFAISWDREIDGDFYDSAKRIGKSRWNSECKSVCVASEMFMEVLDFAKSFEFTLSEKAKVLVEKARIVRDKALVGEPTPVKASKPKPLGERPKKLAAKKTEIDESLLDDDYESL